MQTSSGRNRIIYYSRLSLLRNPRDPVKMFVESEIRFRRNAVQCVAKYEVQRHCINLSWRCTCTCNATYMYMYACTCMWLGKKI